MNETVRLRRLRRCLFLYWAWVSHSAYDARMVDMAALKASTRLPSSASVPSESTFFHLWSLPRIYPNIRSPFSFRKTLLRRSVQGGISCTRRVWRWILRGPISPRQICPRYRSPLICWATWSAHGIYAAPLVGRLPRISTFTRWAMWAGSRCILLGTSHARITSPFYDEVSDFASSSLPTSLPSLPTSMKPRSWLIPS